MADVRGFLKHTREEAPHRPVPERIGDWRETYPGGVARSLLPIITDQASRCMDCGVPFCQTGCPLGNIIPEWNDLVWRGDWDAAGDRLHATNNFPEFTGRLCPAPCESACVLGINQPAVTIRNIEVSIADHAADSGRLAVQPPARSTGGTVAVVGSGPSGLAAAQQLTRAGHAVTVYERADRPGGLLRYGIPEFKMEKSVVDRRLAQLAAEGTVFRTGVEIGVDLDARALLGQHDAVVLALGSTVPRDLAIPGRELAGIHQAMQYLPQGNRQALGENVPDQITATGKHVVIIGGGDTGADCLGTAHRQHPKSVTQLEILPQPPASRPAQHPWPTYPMIFRTSGAHEEGGTRAFQVSTTEFLGDAAGRVRALRLVEVEQRGGAFTEIAGTEREIPADLVLLALGFTGPERDGAVAQLGLDLDARGNIARDEQFMTSVPGVFAAGDAGRGQSLIVWAIAEGRAAAAGVDRFLTGATTLPRPIEATTRPLAV